MRLKGGSTFVMLKKFILVLLLFLQILLCPSKVHAEYESIYNYYIELGLDALYEKKFEDAIFYFKTAHAIDPSRDKAREYINLSKRLKDEQLNGIVAKSPTDSSWISLEGPDPVKNTDTELSHTVAQQMLRSKIPQGSVVRPVVKYDPKAPLVKQKKLPGAIIPSGVQTNSLELRDAQELKLDDVLWSKHTNLILELKVDESVILVGNNIQRYLSVTEGILEVSRINPDRIKLKGLKRGNTIFYVWDQKGRWIFNVHCIYTSASELAKLQKLQESDAQLFKLEYSNNWSTLHSGQNLGSMTRKYLNFTNWLGVFGDTPYGKFDAAVNTYMYPNSTEIVGQTIGLSNGHVGPFNDFSLRGYDAYTGLTSLTLPGRYFRGVLLDAYAFKHRLAYSYFHGQDQSTVIFLGSGARQTRQSYIEGGKLTLNPYQPTNYSLNYVRGWGEGRPEDFVKRVISGQVEHKRKEIRLVGELASDDKHYASTIASSFERSNFKMNLNLRDIEKGYQTIYGPANGTGQVGTLLNYFWNPSGMDISGYLDIYRDRSLPNPDNPHGLNFDWSNSYNKQLDHLSQWGINFAYTNNSQTVSPRQNAQLGGMYSKTFELGRFRTISLFSGPTIQWSRYKDTPTADFDRYNLRSGFRANLIQNLSYFFTYDYIWVRDVAREQFSNPATLDTGFYYHFKLTDELYLTSDISYHREKFTSSPFGFLSGQDNVSNSLSLTYHPQPGIEIYLDSQLRHVMPQNNRSFDELYLTTGMKGSWDLPFKWNPLGEIRGIVYKDYNGNATQDEGEPGIYGIKVLAGHWETYTNDNGEYLLTVRAKKVAVSLDLRTVPQGFVFSTALSRDVEIQNNKAKVVNFGLTARSGIYGVAYFDVNGDGMPNLGDKFLGNVVVRLVDTGEITKTDASGSYFFENIDPGKHKIRISIGSIPKEYLPAVKVEDEVEVVEGITYVYNIPVKLKKP